jgi:hypothetical protein
MEQAFSLCLHLTYGGYFNLGSDLFAAAGHRNRDPVTGMNPKASRGILYPPLHGIVQLSNSATLRFRNWSFTNKIKGK